MKNKQRCVKKYAPTGCGSREGQEFTVRKHPSVHVKQPRCCNKKKKKKKKLINKQLRGESWRRRRRRSVPKSPHILMKCWSGVPGCCLPSLPSSTHAHTHTHTKKPSASARQTPVCTGAAHSGSGVRKCCERKSGGGIRRRSEEEEAGR